MWQHIGHHVKHRDDLNQIVVEIESVIVSQIQYLVENANGGAGTVVHLHNQPNNLLHQALPHVVFKNV